MARRALALLVLGGLIALVWLAIAHLTARRASVTTTAPTLRVSGAPFRSARLLAGLPWSAADRARFASQIRWLVNGGGLPPKSGVVLADPRGGPPLYAHNQDLPLVPASTLKLLVAGAAVRTFGADYRFTTTMVASAPVSGGAIDGDVWLVGSGDPELSTHDLREAARMLKQAGVNVVNGGVYADGSAFGPDGVETSWLAEDLLYGWAAPASAVSIDNGAIEFTITPTTSGAPARVDVVPPGSVDRLSGSINTVPAGYDTALRIDPGPAPQQYTLSGHIPEGQPQKFWRSLQDPTVRAAKILRTILTQGGIQVAGTFGVRPAPVNAQLLWTHRSRPLADIIRHMTFDSDNHIAEQLLRALGRAAHGVGTPANGLLAERTFLERLGADDPNLVLIDGSGLSPDNRVTARALMASLRSMAARRDADQMIALLPRVAVEGTVRFRELAPTAVGRVFGKSGYIDGATGLAGYVKTQNHGVIMYAMLSNDWTTSLDEVWAVQSRVLETAARW